MLDNIQPLPSTPPTDNQALYESLVPIHQSINAILSYLQATPSATSDSDAATKGVVVGGLYLNNGAVTVRRA